MDTSTDAAVVKGDTQVSRCACRRVCIARRSGAGFQHGSEAGRQACGDGDAGADQNGRTKPVGRLDAEPEGLMVQAPKEERRSRNRAKKKDIQKVADPTFSRD